MKKRIGRRWIEISHIIVLCGMLCGCTKASSAEQTVRIAPFERTQEEVVSVEVGDLDVSQTYELRADGQEEKVYTPDHDSMEVEQVYVAEGDIVKKGQLMLTFKMGDAADELTDARKRLEEEQLMYEHFSNLAKIKGGNAYQKDLERIARDMELAKEQITEKQAWLSGYRLTAEEDGIVNYVSTALGSTKCNAQDKLITVTGKLGQYVTTTDSTAEFAVGNTYEATAGVATYQVTLTEMEEIGGGALTKLLFHISDGDEMTNEKTLLLQIKKPILKQVMYIPIRTVFDVDGHTFVYVMDEKGYKVAKEVTVGDRTEESVVILKGLEKTDKVVVRE